MFRIELLEGTIQPVFSGRGDSTGQGTIAEYNPNYGADRAKVESYDMVTGDYTVKGDRRSMSVVENLLEVHGAMTWDLLKELTKYGDDRLSDSIAFSNKIHRKDNVYFLETPMEDSRQKV
jgi:hypothetical protein